MSSQQRHDAAATAFHTKEHGLAGTEQPECPFLSSVRPGSQCNKPGGVCSIRQYENRAPVTLSDIQPAAVCPNRFLEVDGGESVFAYIANALYGVTAGAMVVKEIPFLNKVDAGGVVRGAKAGRIDWVVIPSPPDGDDKAPLDWVGVETQSVYFSGANMWDDIDAYRRDPTHLHLPSGVRRPDYRSSGAKRLAPQLDAKAPVMRRWGRKVVVVVDASFFAELSGLPNTVTDFDNAEVVWLVMRFTDDMRLVVDRLLFAELADSIAALHATQPMNRAEFENGLKAELRKPNSDKVHHA